MVVGDREGREGGGAQSYLYTVFGTAFMVNSTGRRPVSVCVSVCVCVCVYHYMSLEIVIHVVRATHVVSILWARLI